MLYHDKVFLSLNGLGVQSYKQEIGKREVDGNLIIFFSRGCSTLVCRPSGIKRTTYNWSMFHALTRVLMMNRSFDVFQNSSGSESSLPAPSTPVRISPCSSPKRPQCHTSSLAHQTVPHNTPAKLESLADRPIILDMRTLGDRHRIGV